MNRLERRDEHFTLTCLSHLIGGFGNGSGRLEILSGGTVVQGGSAGIGTDYWGSTGFNGKWCGVTRSKEEQATSNQLYLTYTAAVIPEPSTISFIVLALIAVLMFREYRFRRNPVRKRIS